MIHLNTFQAEDCPGEYDKSLFTIPRQGQSVIDINRVLDYFLIPNQNFLRRKSGHEQHSIFKMF